MGHNLVKILNHDNGDDPDNDDWHMIDNFGDTQRVLCTGEAYDGSSSLELKHKTVKRGGISCESCLDVVKFYKSIKL